MAITTITRDLTRTNPTATAVNTIIYTGQMKVFHVVLNNSGVATALDAAGAQRMLEAVGAPVHIAQVEDGGLEVLLVAEGHALDVDTVAKNIGRLFDTAGTTGSVSSGVYTCGDSTGTVTVTIETDLFDM